MLDKVDIKFFKQAVSLANIGKETDVDISAKCPVCGDSQKKRNSKRLHLYTKGAVTNVNCFNGDCSVHNKTVYSFLRDFFPDILPQYKRETFNNTIDGFKQQSSLKDIKKSIEDTPLDDWDIIEEIHKPVFTQDLSSYMLHLKDSDDGITYLRNRGISYIPNKRGKWYYGTQNLKIGDITYNIKDSIIVPLYWDSEMYGFYSRSIKDKNFITYMDNRNIGFKVWNWFHVNLDEPVYIFEGIFDAISSGEKNIIALMGAKLPDDRLKEIKNPVFCLDNDLTGLFNSIDYAKLGYKVYVQPNLYKYCKDMNELMLNHPKLDIPELIRENTYQGISAITRIKAKM